MSWYTSRLGLSIRTIGRRFGLTSGLRKLGFRSKRYEEHFDTILIERQSPDDCVWDVGANVGLYTKKFMARCGSGGSIFAFEPSTKNRARLARDLSENRKVVVRPEALGSISEERGFVQGKDPLGATSSLSSDVGEPVDELVSVARGDELIESGTVGQPTLMKIDTEGAEHDVLLGLQRALHHPALHTIGIEVHFGVLAKRGEADTPRRIETLLRDSGFATRWVDASHIIGTKAR